MTRDPVINFARQYRTLDDYLYLLVDGQAECALNHALSVTSLTESLGAAAITRVLRPDISHSPERCPALIQLAAPGEGVLQHYLERSADYAAWDLGYNERYICGWLASRQPLEVVAKHIATRCDTTAAGKPSPWFEPLRLELLLCAMDKEAGCLLSPIRHWLFPVSWGGYSLMRSPDYYCAPELSELARQTQRLAPVIHAFLGVWRHVQKRPPALAPWRWTGSSILPPQAGVHGFRLIRDAEGLGLTRSRDLISLSLHRVLLHPYLPQHPDVRQIIAQASTGPTDLQGHFANCSDAFWKRVVTELPRAEDYS